MPTPTAMPHTLAPTLTPVTALPTTHQPTTTVIVTAIAPGPKHSYVDETTYHGSELTWEFEDGMLFIYDQDDAIATHAPGTWLNVCDPVCTIPRELRDAATN